MRETWPEAIYLRAHHTTLSYTIESPSAFPLDQRIAILEEDPVKGQSVELTLQNFGYQAHWYASAAELSAQPELLDRLLGVAR